jgi:hypothetical protein
MKLILSLPKLTGGGIPPSFSMPYLSACLSQRRFLTWEKATFSAAEAVFARALGLSRSVGQSLPWAAWRAQQLGLSRSSSSPSTWAFVHPCHWHCTWQAMTLWPLKIQDTTHPHLHVNLELLDAWFQKEAPALFERHGYRLHEDRPGRWLVEFIDALPSQKKEGMAIYFPSAAHCVGSNLTSFLPSAPNPLGRLLNAVQMELAQLWRRPNQLESSTTHPTFTPNAIWVDSVGSLSDFPEFSGLTIQEQTLEGEGHWLGPDVQLVTDCLSDFDGAELLVAKWARWESYLQSAQENNTFSSRGSPVELTFCQGQHALYLDEKEPSLWARFIHAVKKRQIGMRAKHSFASDYTAQKDGHPAIYLQNQFRALAHRNGRLGDAEVSER